MNGAVKKILLVEDEPVAKSLYQNRLQSEGFDVSVAADGEGALNELSKAHADLVVLDLMLPRMSGEEAVKQIRSNDRLKETPVLIISNAYMTEMSQRAMESGATRGLLKTECTPARLVETIRDLLGYRSAFDVSNAAVDDDKSIEEFANAAEKALADEIKLKETREEFIKKSSGEIARIREHCRAYVKSAGTEGASEPLSNLYQQVRFFATRAGLSGCVQIALVANAFEALLFDVRFKPSRATPSISQTFAQAVDCLERLCQAKDGGVREVIPRAKILVVDDDAVCNLAMTAALKRAHFEPVAVEDSTKVMTLAKSTQFDIVMLDINMPGMNGFELCKSLRGMPQYRETPVIFITANADFQNRAQSILSGGNDLIPKPVSPLELVLKVTMRLLQPQGVPSPGVPSPNAPAPISNAGAAPVPVPEQKALQKDVKPKEPEAPQLPRAVKQESSFSTEMLRKAWSGDTETEKAKPAQSHGVNGAESVSPPDTKIELPKIETVAGKEDAKAPSDAEKRKSNLEAISIGPLKMADDDKPKHVNGVDKTDELKQMEPKIELPKVEAPKVEAEAPKVETPKGEAPTVETPKVEVPNVEIPKVEALKIEEPKVEAPPPAPVEARQPEPETKPEPAPAPAAAEEKPAEPVARAEEPLSPEHKPQHIHPNMETTKKPTLDEAARGVARIIFGDENISDMNVRLTRIALEKYNVPGTQKIDDVARGVSQIIFGDDKVSEMNVRLTRIALERYNVSEVLHLNGSNGANGANGTS
ncbi:MAG TPA: response regulator [Candidatus Sulfotelmatobacter sp.]|nr:response regulator [Candidatus Sulfotelmatobacter sp.]